MILNEHEQYSTTNDCSPLFTPKFYKYSTRYTVDELNANVDNMYS